MRIILRIVATLGVCVGIFFSGAKWELRTTKPILERMIAANKEVQAADEELKKQSRRLEAADDEMHKQNADLMKESSRLLAASEKLREVDGRLQAAFTRLWGQCSATFRLEPKAVGVRDQ